MYTIEGFYISDAMVFHKKESAAQLCEKLNLDKELLYDCGCTDFEVINQ